VRAFSTEIHRDAVYIKPTDNVLNQVDVRHVSPCLLSEVLF